MSEENSLMGEAVKQSKEVLGKAYDDLVHPTAQPVGNIISLIPRTINVWLGKWQKWIINGEESIRLTTEAVKEKAAKIPEEKLTEPEPYVAIPAIQQLCYCYDSEELRELYANLLVSSMNADTKFAVHPAFVDIIKQLTPDEAKIIKKLKEDSCIIGIVELRVVLESGFIELIRDYTPYFNSVCVDNTRIGQYLQNISRLGIIKIRYDQHVLPISYYDKFDQDPVIVELKSKNNIPNTKFQYEKGLIELTEYGQHFCKVCIDTGE